MQAPPIQSFQKKRRTHLTQKNIDTLQHLVSSPKSIRRIKTDSKQILSNIVSLIEQQHKKTTRISQHLNSEEFQILNTFFNELKRKVCLHARAYDYATSIKSMTLEVLQDYKKKFTESYSKSVIAYTINTANEELTEQINDIETSLDNILHSPISDSITTARSTQQKTAYRALAEIKKSFLKDKNILTLLNNTKGIIEVCNKLLAKIQSLKLLSYKHSYGETLRHSLNKEIKDIYNQLALRDIFQEKETNFIASLKQVKSEINAVINSIFNNVSIKQSQIALYHHSAYPLGDPHLSNKIELLKQHITDIKQTAEAHETIASHTQLIDNCNELLGNLDTLNEQKTLYFFRRVKKNIQTLFNTCVDPYQCVAKYQSDVDKHLGEINHHSFLEPEKHLTFPISPRSKTIPASIENYHSPYI